MAGDAPSVVDLVGRTRRRPITRYKTRAADGLVNRSAIVDRNRIVLAKWATWFTDQPLGAFIVRAGLVVLAPVNAPGIAADDVLDFLRLLVEL
jgi:hypothetical protein